MNAILSCEHHEKSKKITMQYFDDKKTVMACSSCIEDIKDKIKNGIFTHTKILEKDSNE